MKNFKFASLILAITVVLSSCGGCNRVPPNYKGVLMENFGKSKSDFKVVMGRVSTWSPGSELFTVPMWEQRNSFKDNEENNRVLHLKSADNTEFTSSPTYSYKVLNNDASIVDLVFNNARLGSGEEFMDKLEDNILEANIYDIMKDESRAYSTDTLMAPGGSLQYENRVRALVDKKFRDYGLELKTFTAQLEFSNKVKEKIDTRNEVNTNISVLDQQILEQRKRNELAALKAEENRILSSGLTPQLLQQEFYEAWKEAKVPLYGTNGVNLFKSVQ